MPQEEFDPPPLRSLAKPPESYEGTRLIPLLSGSSETMVLAGTMRKQRQLREVVPTLNNHCLNWAILKPDPGNQHDQNAVSVHSLNGKHIGFINSNDTPYVGEPILRFCLANSCYVVAPLEIFEHRRGTDIGAKVHLGEHDIPEVSDREVEKGRKKLRQSNGKSKTHPITGCCAISVLALGLLLLVALLGPVLC